MHRVGSVVSVTAAALLCDMAPARGVTAPTKEVPSEEVELVIPEPVEPAPATDAAGINLMCPVQPDVPALPEFAITHEGRTIRFCCDECREKFLADPERYLNPNAARFAAKPPAEAAAWRLPRTLLKRYKFLLATALLVGILWPFERGRLTRLWRARVRVPMPFVFFAVALAGDFIYAQTKQRQVDELRAIETVHYATFHDYGYPPVPYRPPVAKQLSAFYYRGNDERSDKLFNGGYYRTATFHVSLVDNEGKAVDYGAAVDLADLRLRIETRRAPNTPDFFWAADRMARAFATRSTDKFLWRDGPVEDAVFMTTLKPLWAWEILYPLRNFAAKDDAQGRPSLSGIVYLCERLKDRDGLVLGARMHYAIQFELSSAQGTLSTDSDLWMGSIYRTRKLPIWKIAAEEWFSHNPIPVVPGPHLQDPELLGIADYQEEDRGLDAQGRRISGE